VIAVHRPRRLTAWSILAAVTVLASVRAQDVPQAPTITVSTHLVEISVIARSSKGTPATGLTKDDIVVRDEGKARKISVFEVESDGTKLKAAESAAPDTFSNRTEETLQAGGMQGGAVRNAQGNVTILLLDNLNTLSGSHAQNYEDSPMWMEDGAALYAKQKLLVALKQMDRGDRIAIYVLGGSLRLLCDFTCDREQQIAAVKAYDPKSKTLREAAEPGNYRLPGMDESFSSAVNNGNEAMAAQFNGQRAAATLMSLSVIVQHVAAIPGRKSLVWLTADLPIPGPAAARLVGPANIAIYPVDARGLMAAQFVENTSVHGPPPPPATSGAVPPGIEAMWEMAHETGGRAYVNTNGIAQAIREVAEDSGVRYTIGFYVDAASVDGKFHEVKLHVDRPGVTLEAPQGYFATRDATPSDTSHAMLLAAIQSPYDATAITLDITAAKLEKPKPHMLQLTGSIGIAGLPMPAEGDGHATMLEVRLVEQDAAGNVIRQAIHRMELRLSEAQYRAYLGTGVAFRQTLEPLPATAVVRVLVREPRSRQLGSVILPLRQVK
jgi:VWFA-related protein